MNQPTIIRCLYLAAAAGFMLQGVASFMGSAPRWPNRNLWGIVAFAVALTLVLYVIVHHRSALRLAVASIVLASIGRMIGWLVSAPSAAARMAAGSAWVIVASLALLVYIKAWRAHGET